MLMVKYAEKRDPRTLLVYGNEQEIRTIKLMAFKSRMKISRFIIMCVTHYGEKHSSGIKSLATSFQNLEIIKDSKKANTVSGSLVHSHKKLRKAISEIKEEYNDEPDLRDLLILDKKKWYAKSNKAAINEIKRRNR